MILSRALFTVIVMLSKTFERLKTFLTGLTNEHLRWFVVNVLQNFEMIILRRCAVFSDGRRESDNLEPLRGQDDIPGLESAEEVGLSSDGGRIPDDLD